MDSEKERKVAATIAALRDRWGNKAIGRLQADGTGGIPCVSTGLPVLDETLGIGGLPRGRISEITGIPSSGMTTIALKVATNAQAAGDMVIYIDLDGSFDPDYAARHDLSLEQMVLVRPADIVQALAILHDFVLGDGVSSLIFDASAALLATPQATQALTVTLGRLIAPLDRMQGVLLFLTSLPAGSSTTMANQPVNSALAHFTTVRLFIQRAQWIYQGQDIGGYQTQLLVVKNKLGPAGRQVHINITFFDAL